MKAFLTLLLLSVSLLATAQQDINAEQWRSDLQFLRQTIHTDYPFLLRKTSKEAFDAAVDKLDQEIPQLESHQIIVGMMRIVSSIQYGHTAMSSREWPTENHRLPLNYYWFSDGIYIQGAHKDYEDIVGTRLVAIEGMPVDNVLNAIKPVVPVENDQFFKAYGLGYMNIAEVLHAQGITKELKNEIELTVEKDGKELRRSVGAMALSKLTDVPLRYGMMYTEGDWIGLGTGEEAPLYLSDLDRIYTYKYLPEKKALYVRQSQVQDDSIADIPTFYNEVFDFIAKNDVDKLVLDVRLNGGGNNYKNKPVVTGIIRSEKINKEGHFMVITGRRTFSACQNLVNELDNYTYVVFVGEPTAENINFYGDTNRVVLPESEIPVFLSFAWWQDKPQWENGPWIAPHVATDQSFAQFMAGEDPALDAALNFSMDDLILDPMEHFTNLFMTGQIDKLRSDAKAMTKDDRYRFFDFEGEFNKTGYRLLSQGQTQEAVFVFQLVLESYPNSANAWYSLGDGLRAMGDKAQAKEAYQKSAAMEPGTDLAAESLKKASELEN
ncbi:tetratricopeptide repeat protein [Aureitalea marina]|uniref:Uncharacterized protein n=1 Tax=Aureitalea marina TaxID=930804 RepID=A0A2S7KP63_9FLAO|nr:tetratricopeptide repeat protein [Aureitalea marina]PQB04412.1 hypothetical protein BST85_05495 [Aureitalea marina]